MSEERLQIMKMVEEGKLSAEEAVKLLEAVEAPPAAGGGPKPGRVRVQITEAGKSTHFVVSATLDKTGLVQALAGGAPGKVFEAAEGGRKVEVWLEV